MKDKILMFIVGVLLGVIITSLGFFIYEKMMDTQRMKNIPDPFQMEKTHEFKSGEMMERSEENRMQRQERKEMNFKGGSEI